MLDRAARVLGYVFKDEQILAESLTHASYTAHRLQSNERMEFLGDAILGYVICEYLFQTYPALLEGELTKIKSAVVSRRVCALISEKLDLGSFLIMGKGMASREVLPLSILAGVFESVIAAIYLDGGFEPARTFILEHLAPYIEEAASSTHQENFKSALQQHAQKHMPGKPVYLVLDEKGPDHSKCFEVCVELEGQRFNSAWAKSKKEAEQAAALTALRQLGLIEEDKNNQIHLKPFKKIADS